MKTKQLFWIFTLTLLVLSCTKETLRQEDALLPSESSSQPSQPVEPQKPPRPQMTLSAYSQGAEDEAPAEDGSAAETQAEEGSKLSFIDNSGSTGNFSVAWDETISNESIRVLGKDASGEYIEDDNVVLKGSNRISAHKAEFTGDAPSEDSRTFDIIYPSDYESIEDFKTRGFGQTQASSGSTAHLTYNALFKDMKQCSYVNFSERWAREQGLDFYCTSCLKLTLQLPDERDVEAVDGVKEISIISSDANNFYRTNDSGSKTNILSISFADWNTVGGNVDKVSKSGYTQRTITAYFMLAGFDQSISTENTYTIKFVDASGYTWTKTGWAPKATTVMTQGNMYTLTINKSSFAKGTQYVDSGTGTAADPYIIRTPTQMDAARNLLVDVWVPADGDYTKATTEDSYRKTFDGVDVIPHFKLANDLDMSAYSSWDSWVTDFGNADSGGWKGKIFAFDGDGYTISNMSSVSRASGYSGVFGRIIYKLENLTLDNIVNAYSGSAAMGLVAGWIGGERSYEPLATVINVHIKNSKMSYAGSNALEVGAFCCRCGRTTFTGCSVDDCEISQASRNATDTIGTGGFIGVARGMVDFVNCTSKGTKIISHNHYATGGYVGVMRVQTGPSYNLTEIGSFSGCSSDATIFSDNFGIVGGFVGNFVSKNKDVSLMLGTNTFSGTCQAYSKIGGIIGSDESQGSYTLTLSGCSIDSASLIATKSGAYSLVGGLIGLSERPLTISNSTVNATTVKGNNSCGGVIGKIGAYPLNISYCSTDGIVTNYDPENTHIYSIFGGIVGSVTGGATNITRCSSTMTVTAAGTSAGGIVAQADPSTESIVIDCCGYDGTLTNSGNYSGGIIAYSKQRPITIKRSRTSGVLLSKYSISGEGTTQNHRNGGIAGYINTSDGTYSATIEDCYSTMDITNEGHGYVGGIAGDVDEKVVIQYCVYFGNQNTQEGGHIKANYAAGGIVGRATHMLSSQAASTAEGGYGNKVHHCLVGYLSFTSYDGVGRTTTEGSLPNGAIAGLVNINDEYYSCSRLKSGSNGVTRTYQWFKNTDLDAKIMTGDYTQPSPNNGSTKPVTNFAEGGNTDYAYHGQYNTTNFLCGVMKSLHFDERDSGNTWKNIVGSNKNSIPALSWEP